MDKSCVNHLLQPFHEIYKSFQLQYLDQKKILKRFVNFFFKDVYISRVRGTKNETKKTVLAASVHNE